MLGHNCFASSALGRLKVGDQAKIVEVVEVVVVVVAAARDFGWMELLGFVRLKMTQWHQ